MQNSRLNEITTNVRTPERYSCYDELEFQKIFVSDLRAAQNFLIIQSAFVSSRAVGRYLPIIREKVATGVRVCIFVQEPEHWRRRTHPDLPQEIATRLNYFEDVIASLVQTGAHVNVCVKVHEKFVIIDERIVWQGSLNFLSHRDTFECPSRWQSRARVIEAIAKYRLDTCRECWIQMGRTTSNESEINSKMQQIAAFILRQRELLHLSQADVSERTGLHQSFISRFECGRRNIPTGTAVRIADALGLELVAVPRMLRHAVEHLVAQRLANPNDSTC